MKTRLIPICSMTLRFLPFVQITTLSVKVEFLENTSSTGLASRGMSRRGASSFESTYDEIIDGLPTNL
jgi:hypothetical protein